MIRLERYVHSRRPYAVDLATLVVDHRPPTPWRDQNGGEHISAEYWRLRIDAVWFRGPVAAPAACIGTLSWSTARNPHDGTCSDCIAEDAVARHEDGRYGGDCLAKLNADGTMWTADRLAAADVLAFEDRLAPILQRFPEVPEGFSGWWTFVPDRSTRRP